MARLRLLGIVVYYDSCRKPVRNLRADFFAPVNFFLVDFLPFFSSKKVEWLAFYDAFDAGAEPSVVYLSKVCRQGKLDEGNSWWHSRKSK